MTDWKPGDVAVVRNEFDVWNVAICSLRAGHRGFVWRYGVTDVWRPVKGSEARPLVVIDSDDTGQVERLVRCFWDATTDDGDDDACMAAALREFATPPPPLCGDHLFITGDKDRPVSYTCTLNAGHDGAHHDAPATTAWRQTSTRADA